MKSRLKKIAIMSPDMFQGQLDQISDQGRNILKSIEEYKFFVEQASRVVKNDQKLTELIINKKKNLDQAAQQIYDVVFEIENVDVIALYNEQQKSTEENKEPKKQDVETPTSEENTDKDESAENKETKKPENSEDQKNKDLNNDGKDNSEKLQDDDKKEDK